MDGNPPLNGLVSSIVDWQGLGLFILALILRPVIKPFNALCDPYVLLNYEE